MGQDGVRPVLTRPAGIFQALKVTGALGQDQREGRLWEGATYFILPGQTCQGSGLRVLKEPAEFRAAERRGLIPPTPPCLQVTKHILIGMITSIH